MDQISLERNYAEKSHEWPFMTLAVQCQYLHSLARMGYIIHKSVELGRTKIENFVSIEPK